MRTHRYIYIYTYLSIHLSIYLSVYLFIYLSAYLPIYLSIYLTVYVHIFGIYIYIMYFSIFIHICICTYLFKYTCPNIYTHACNYSCTCKCMLVYLGLFQTLARSSSTLQKFFWLQLFLMTQLELGHNTRHAWHRHATTDHHTTAPHRIHAFHFKHSMPKIAPESHMQQYKSVFGLEKPSLVKLG